jgi:hypothetical protein
MPQLLKGDLHAANRAMRRLLTSLDSAAYALSMPFDWIDDPKVIDKLKKTQAAAELTADRLFSALSSLETSEAYKECANGQPETRDPLGRRDTKEIQTES